MDLSGVITGDKSIYQEPRPFLNFIACQIRINQLYRRKSSIEKTT